MEENGVPHADYMLPDGTISKKLENYYMEVNHENDYCI
jgi:hypothetical protein